MSKKIVRKTFIPEEKIYKVDFVIGDQYHPQIIVDHYGNKGVVLSSYIAGNLRRIIEVLHEAQIPFSSGDWFDDTLLYIPADFAANQSVEGYIKALEAWVERLPEKEKNT